MLSVAVVRIDDTGKEAAYMRWWTKRRRDAVCPPEKLPVHVGIIMDGNGRWAKRRGLPRQAGHGYGAKTFRTITKHCEKRGIQYLTVYAFSTENWSRPQVEVDAIMDLLREYLRESLEDFQKENIRTRFIGDRSPLAPDIQALMRQAEDVTAHKTGMCLNIAVNYGGREELVHAARSLAREAVQGKRDWRKIDDTALAAHLYTAGQPEPDLILRPSGEYRLSNFLLWQSAYSEYIFMDILWPDFKTTDLDRALEEYARRQRRFGGI